MKVVCVNVCYICGHSRSAVTGRGLSYHKAPSKQLTRPILDKWLEFLHLPPSNLWPEELWRKICLCSLHFVDDDYHPRRQEQIRVILRDNVVPTKFRPIDSGAFSELFSSVGHGRHESPNVGSSSSPSIVHGQQLAAVIHQPESLHNGKVALSPRIRVGKFTASNPKKKNCKEDESVIHYEDIDNHIDNNIIIDESRDSDLQSDECHYLISGLESSDDLKTSGQSSNQGKQNINTLVLVRHASPKHNSQKKSAFDVLKDVVARQNVQDREIQALRSEIQELKQLLVNRTEVLAMPKDFPALPFQTFIEAQAAEEQIGKDTLVRDYVIKKLSLASHGCSDKECTRKVLEHLMSHHLGTLYTWGGRRGKESFSKSQLCEVTKLAIKNIRGQPDMEAVQKSIKGWLKSSRKVARNKSRPEDRK